MKITADTTIGQLHLELAKLGVHSQAWTFSDGTNAVTFVTHEHRIMMFGEDLVETIGRAVTELENRIAGDAIMFQHRTNTSEYR